MIDEWQIKKIKDKYLTGGHFNAKEANRELQNLFHSFIENLEFKEGIVSGDEKVNALNKSLNASVASLNASTQRNQIASDILKFKTYFPLSKKDSSEYNDLIKRIAEKEQELHQADLVCEKLAGINADYKKKMSPILRRKKKRYNLFGWRYICIRYLLLFAELLSALGIAFIIEMILKINENIYVFISLFLLTFFIVHFWLEQKQKKFFLKLHIKNFKAGIAYLEDKFEEYMNWLKGK